MFIRETFKTIKNKKYSQFKLVESIRTPVGPRQKIILILNNLDLSKDKWKELANRIEDIIYGCNNLFTINDPEIDKLAEHYAAIIIKQKLNDNNRKNNNKELTEKPDYEEVDINTLKTQEAKTVGAEHVVIDQINKYKFDNILKEQGFSEKEIVYAKMLIVSRMVHPSSERESARWLTENSGLSEILKSDLKIYDNALHRISQKLLAKKEIIEENLNKAAKDIFNLDETLILYDLTNTYFESRKRKSEIAKFGISKEKRNDLPIITLALKVDEEGFPKSSKILKGNVAESKTLVNILEELDKDKEYKKGSKTIVVDAGIGTEENIKIMKSKGIKYVCVSRRKKELAGLEIEPEREIQIRAKKKERIKVKLIEEKDEIYCVCYSPDKEKRDKDIWESKSKKYELELGKIDKRLKEGKGPKKHEKIVERIGRLKERYKLNKYYQVKVIEKAGIAISINYKKLRDKEFGKYILRTNRKDLSGEEISKLYRTLTRIESSFRSMKSDLGIRPNYHQKDEMSIAHISITVLGYHFMSGILKRLKDKEINYSWNSIRNILATHVRVTTSFKSKKEEMINIRNTVKVNSSQREIYNKLGINQDPLNSIKIKIPLKTTKKV